MKQKLDLTPAEWTLMECLWDRAPQTGRELTQQMQRATGWNRSTTLTLLRRLREKGAVSCNAEGKTQLFSPAISRSDAAVQQTKDLLGRVYHGSLPLLVSAMTQEQRLSRSEIDELCALLRQMEEKQQHD